jgi:hypothetical protein
MRGETTQAPLVLQLIKAVLTVSPVTVKLSDGLYGALHIGHHHRVLPQAFSLEYAGSRQLQAQLPVINAPLTGNATAQTLAVWRRRSK